MTPARRAQVFLLLLPLLLLSACGYTLVRDKGIFSGEITALSIPMFKNETFEAHSPGYFTEAFSRELAASGLFNINKEASDATLIGTITNITIAPYSYSGQGLAVEKTVRATITLTMNRQGNLVRTWTFNDSEPYRAVDVYTSQGIERTDISLEDFNRRQALQTIAARMARRFHSQVLSDY